MIRPASLVLIVAAALATACQPLPQEPLRVGLNAWPGYEFLYLAEARGFYEAEGVDVQLLEFGSLSDTRRAYERGQIDAMGASIVEALTVRAHSTRTPRIVRAIDYSDGADVILAQPWLHDAAQLDGARVGVEGASLPALLLARGLEHLGVDPARVHTSSMDQTTMEAAFRRGDLDAIVTYPPASVRLARDFGARTLFSSSSIPGDIVDVLMVEADVIARRRRDVAALLRAFDRARQFARDHPAEAAAVMARREGLTPAEFMAALTDGVVFVNDADQARYLAPGGTVERVMRQADRLLRRDGQLSGPPRLDDLVDAGFLPEGRR